MARVEEWAFSSSSSSSSDFVQADITGIKSINGDSNTVGMGTLATDILVAVSLVECSQAINDLTNNIHTCFPPIAISKQLISTFWCDNLFPFKIRTAVNECEMVIQTTLNRYLLAGGEKWLMLLTTEM